MAVTVEPGVYLPGRGGVRIEDTLVVTDDAPELLTLTTKELLVLSMATTNDLKNGLVLNLDGQLWTVVEFQHVKPGKGGAFVRTKLKNVLSGKVVDKTFNAGTKVETANVDKRDDAVPLQRRRRLRLHGQRHLRPDPRAGRDRRRRRRTTCSRTQEAIVAMHEGAPLYVELPASVELVVEHTEPGLQGDRSTGGTKPATLETGARDPGAAVHHHRREDQGRHPRRPLPRPRQLSSSRHGRPHQGPQAGAGRPLRGRRCAAATRSTALRDRHRRRPTPPVPELHGATLVEGVAEHPAASTSCSSTYAEGWTLDRMPAVDRNLLRIGVFELLWADDVPDAVAINEAVELAKALSTDDSPAFVNGVLGAILAAEVPSQA